MRYGGIVISVVFIVCSQTLVPQGNTSKYCIYGFMSNTCIYLEL